MDFAQRVKNRRIDLNMTQEELAFKMGYKSRVSINKIENGRPVSQKIIVKLADALDTTPAYLMGWDTDNSSAPTAANGADAYLTDDETTLVQFFRQLNLEGCAKLLDYADDLVSSGKYIKSNQAEA